MVSRVIGLGLAAIVLIACGLSEAAQHKEKKKRTGTVTGEVKSSKPTPNGKNTVIEVLASGEEKARPYRVNYDPKIKGPVESILKAVRAAKVGDRVQLEWVDTGEGLAITSFQVLKKAEDRKDKKDS